MSDAAVERIERIEAFRVRVPLPHALRVWGREITAREFVFVRAHAGGHTGVGFAFTRGMPLDVVVEQQIAQFAEEGGLGEVKLVMFLKVPAPATRSDAAPAGGSADFGPRPRRLRKAGDDDM